jgi:putative sterol carrier protein
MGLETIGLAPPLTIDRDCADRIVDLLVDSWAAMEEAIMPRERAHAAQLAANRVDSIDEFFARMHNRFDPERAAGVDFVGRFELSGEGGGSWTVTVRDASLEVARVGADEAHVVFRATASDYLAIVNGDLGGADAFSSGRLSVEGDLNQAAALSQLGLA